MTPQQENQPVSPAFLAERERLSDDLKAHYDRMVEDYRYFAFIHHTRPFVSYKVLADLVRGGWRRLEAT